MGYERVKLVEVASIRGGKRLPAGREFTNTKTAHPYIRARDIGGGKVEVHDPVFLDEVTAQKLVRYTVNKGDVCLTIVGANVGEMGVVPPHLNGANLTENAVKIVTNGKADQSFLKYALLSDDAMAQMKVLAGGAAQPKLGIYKIETIEFPFPPLQVQRHIAGTLSAYDDLIENNQRRIRILEYMARSLYRECLREAGDAVSAKSILETDYWKFISANVSPYEGMKRYYATADVDRLTIVGAGIDYTFEEKPSRAQKQPTPFSAWFARMKDTYKIAWYSGINSESAGASILSSGFAGCQALEPCYFPLLFLTISSQEFHVQKDLFCTGATQMSLTNEGLARIQVPVPSEAYARQIGEQTLPLLNQVLVLQSQIQNLRRTRDLLLPRLLSGSIAINLEKS